MLLNLQSMSGSAGPVCTSQLKSSPGEGERCGGAGCEEVHSSWLRSLGEERYPSKLDGRVGLLRHICSLVAAQWGLKFQH